jgi:hypothetical protein
VLYPAPKGEKAWPRLATPERIVFVRFRRQLVAQGLDRSLFAAIARDLEAKGATGQRLVLRQHRHGVQQLGIIEALAVPPQFLRQQAGEVATLAFYLYGRTINYLEYAPNKIRGGTRSSQFRTVHQDNELPAQFGWSFPVFRRLLGELCFIAFCVYFQNVDTWYVK